MKVFKRLDLKSLIQVDFQRSVKSVKCVSTMSYHACLKCQIHTTVATSLYFKSFHTGPGHQESVCRQCHVMSF